MFKTKALCPMLYALCSMPSALCPMLYALCSMPSALCSMPSALCPLLSTHHHRIKLAPHVNPLPKAAKQTRSPLFTLPASTASARAMGMEAAVVLP